MRSIYIYENTGSQIEWV